MGMCGSGSFLVGAMTINYKKRYDGWASIHPTQSISGIYVGISPLFMHKNEENNCTVVKFTNQRFLKLNFV